MTKEVRSNLIVLGVVLAIMAPGAVILFRKKLEPTSRRMYMPDPVVSSTAWCDPIPPELLKRVVPAKSAAWFTAEVSRAFAVVPAGWETPERPAPVMSARRWVQFIGRGSGVVRIAIWDERATAETLTIEGGTVTKTVVVPVTKDVRHDLQDIGFVLPPERILLAEVAVPDGVTELQVTWRKGGQSGGWSGGTDVLKLP